MTALQNLVFTAGRPQESPTDPPRRPLVVWVRVCRIGDLERERGLAALIDGEQVALFRTHDDRIHAVQQLDPYSGAFVMSRGIVGTRADAPTTPDPSLAYTAERGQPRPATDADRGHAGVFIAGTTLEARR